MKIQENKTYLTRNGLTVTGLKKEENGTSYKFTATIVEPEFKTPSVRSWTENGFFLTNGHLHRLDIIEEKN